MTTYLIEKLATNVVKDQMSGVLLQRVTYKTNSCVEHIETIASYGNRLPDNFELEVADEHDSHDIVDQTMDTINEIALHMTDTYRCPKCNEVLHLVQNHVICLNLSCMITDDESALRLKFMVLVPNIPVRYVHHIIILAEQDGHELNVMGIINYAKEIIATNKDNTISDTTKLFLNSMKALSLSSLITATLGTAIGTEFIPLIQFYGDSIAAMVADSDTFFAQLHLIGISADTRILLSLLVAANRPLLQFLSEP